jgi:hypothetical protein
MRYLLEQNLHLHPHPHPLSFSPFLDQSKFYPNIEIQQVMGNLKLVTNHCSPEFIKEVAIPKAQSRPEPWKLFKTFSTREVSSYMYKI